MERTLIAVLGRESGEVDGVGDYCRLLGEALGRRGHPLELFHLDWTTSGWFRALRRLWSQARPWRGETVLLQYTAFSWSRSGIPVAFLIALLLVRTRGARPVVVYHDALPHPAGSFVGRIRAVGQRFVMRRAYRGSVRAILTIPGSAATWLPDMERAVTIPVGSNVVGAVSSPPELPPRERLVAVFGVTGGPSGLRELDDVAGAIGPLAERVPGLRVAFFGSGTDALEAEIHARLPRADVRGVVAAAAAHDLLQRARAALFVRGPVTSGRTTAVAALVAGTPVVGYRSELTGPPIADAGVLLVPWRRPGELARALERVVTDEPLWRSLHDQAQAATVAHFGWPAIGRAYLDALGR